MDDEWPPPAPKVNKAFKRAHTATNDNASLAERPEIVSKIQIEELERQRKKQCPAWNSRRRECGLALAAIWSAKRIEKMKKRLQQSKGNARDDLSKSSER